MPWASAQPPTVRYPDEYYYYDKVFDRLHQLGGVAGYAHQAESFHGYRGLMLDGLRRKIDVLELLQFCVSQDPLQTRHYYHLLDLGYSVTAVAGSDFPWCGKDHDGKTRDEKGRIGNARFYSFISSPLSHFTSWRNAVRSGHTFVTSGPMLTLTVNNKLPGDTLYTKRGSTININAQAYGHTQQVPLERLELVAHGKVIATATQRQRQLISNLVPPKAINGRPRYVASPARLCRPGAGRTHYTGLYIGRVKQASTIQKR